MTTCQHCREEHDAARSFTYDGHGINGCDLYRARLATFAASVPEATRATLGPQMAAAPQMAQALALCLELLTDPDAEPAQADAATDAVRAALHAAGYDDTSTHDRRAGQSELCAAYGRHLDQQQKGKA